MMIKSYRLVALFFFSFIIIAKNSKAQELFVISEPASIMPTRSVMIKQSYQQLGGKMNSSLYNTQLEFSFKKNWMMHIGTNFTASEIYLQNRLYSLDDIHSHTRLAFFLKAINSPFQPNTDAIMIDGQEKLWNAGFIATRLDYKWASSFSAGCLHRLTANSKYAKNGIEYIWSNGWLLYPKNYINYKQTNINFYVECIGQQLINDKTHYLDIAPAVQFIFNSQAKFNLGYKWPITDNSNRLNNKSLYISFDYLFFNALPKNYKSKKINH